MGVFDSTTPHPSPRRRSNLPLAAAILPIGLAAGLVVWSLAGHALGILLVIVASAAVVGLYYSVPYIARHNDWLILPLILTFLLISNTFLNEKLRVLIHYAALFAFCVPAAPMAYRSGILREGGFKLYAIYLGWAAITITYSLSPVYSLARLFEAVLLLTGLAASVLTVDNSESAIRLLRHFLIGCGIVFMALAITSVILPHSLAWQSPEESYSPDEIIEMHKLGVNIYGLDRFRGIFGNPNDLGELMLIIVGPALVCWRSAGRRERWLLAALVGGSMFFAALADSRSAFAALAAGCGFYVAWKWGMRGVLVCLGVLGLAVLAALSVDPDLAAYVNRGDIGTLTGRTDMWAFVIHQIKSQPITGHGYGVAGAVLDSRYFPLWWGPWDLGPHSSLHNGYLEHAVEVGIPATILWLYIVLRPWFFLFRQKADPWNLIPVCLLIVIPILISNLTEDLLGDFSGTVALLFGLAWAIAERYRLLALKQAETERKEHLAKLPRAAAALATSR